MATRDKRLNYERDCALYEAYKKARKQLYSTSGNSPDGLKRLHERAIKMAMNTRQTRFWLSQDRTTRILRGLIRGKGMPKTWSTRVPMQRELLNTYERLKNKRMFKGMSVRFIASFVTFEPASGFFLSYSRAKRAIYRQMQIRKGGLK